MPYIKEDRRCNILPVKPYPKGWKELLDISEINTAGELNYAITGMIQTYFNKNGENYQAINDIVGALEGAKAEFQRRVVAPYEDTKIKENGDVY